MPLLLYLAFKDGYPKFFKVGQSTLYTGMVEYQKIRDMAPGVIICFATGNIAWVETLVLTYFSQFLREGSREWLSIECVEWLSTL
jgi:hypothetical protein